MFQLNYAQNLSSNTVNFNILSYAPHFVWDFIAIRKKYYPTVKLNLDLQINLICLQLNVVREHIPKNVRIKLYPLNIL